MPTVRVCVCECVALVFQNAGCRLSLVGGGPVSKCKLKWSWSWSGSRCLLQFHSEIKAALGAAYSHKLFISRSLGFVSVRYKCQARCSPPLPSPCPSSSCSYCSRRYENVNLNFALVPLCLCHCHCLLFRFIFISFAFLPFSGTHDFYTCICICICICMHTYQFFGRSAHFEQTRQLFIAFGSAHSLWVLSNTIKHKTKRAIKACSNHINHGSFGSPCDTRLVPADHQQHQQVLSICIDIGLTLP